jgi:hypothetical protein
MLRNALLAGLALLPGCVPIPQTRAEFVTAAKNNSTGAANESFIVEKGFDWIVPVLEERIKACLNQRVDWSSAVTNEVGSDTYLSYVEKPESGRALFTVQVDRTPRGPLKQPAGGLFILAEDLSGGAGKTKVDLYYPTMNFKAVVKSIREWTHGEKTDCPNLAR